MVPRTNHSRRQYTSKYEEWLLSGEISTGSMKNCKLLSVQWVRRPGTG